MPKQPKTYHLAAIAVSHVRLLFEQSGFVCDETKADYGEDLVIIPSHADSVDPFRIYVQVKGVGKRQASRAKTGSFKLRFKKGHLQKWVRSPELVVVAIWLEEKNQVLYVIPSQIFTEWFLDQCNFQTISVCLNEMLTESSISRIVWAARISNFNRLLLNAMSHVEYLDDESRDSSSTTLTGMALGSKQERQTEIAAIAMSFLKTIGLMERVGEGVRLSEVCLNRVKEISIEIVETSGGIGIEEMATLLVLFKMYKIPNSCGIPAPLLEKCTEILAAIMRSFMEEHGLVCSRCGGPLADTASA